MQLILLLFIVAPISFFLGFAMCSIFVVGDRTDYEAKKGDGDHE